MPYKNYTNMLTFSSMPLPLRLSSLINDDFQNPLDLLSVSKLRPGRMHSTLDFSKQKNRKHSRGLSVKKCLFRACAREISTISSHKNFNCFGASTKINLSAPTLIDEPLIMCHWLTSLTASMVIKPWLCCSKVFSNGQVARLVLMH